jgi:enoyl-CoA hydratase/carnithine racemase
MTHVKIESRESVAIMRLNNEVTNALSPEVVDDLSSALTQVKNEFQGIILAGGAKFFASVLICRDYLNWIGLE